MADVPTYDDALTRQQAYLEGYKLWQNNQYDGTAEQIVAALILLLLKMDYPTLSDMPKREFALFIRQASKKVNDLNKAGMNAFDKLLRQFTSAEERMQRLIFKKLSGVTITGLDVPTVWDRIRNDPVPGIGTEPKQVVKAFANSVLIDTSKALKRAYAEKLTLQQTIALFNGTKANSYKDGLSNKFINQYRAMGSTLIQNVATYIRYQFIKMVADRYQWVSVLDSRTTEVCRDRDGRVYDWGNGPRPPAHYNCRSTIIPVQAAVDVPSLYAWAMNLPATVQNDIFGRRVGTGLRSGTVKSTDMQKFTTTRELTLTQYSSKRNNVTTT